MSPVTIVGNLTKEPDIRIANSGKAVCSASIAVNERVQRNGEWVNGEATYWRITVFGPYGEAFADTAKKGDLVIAHGKLKQSNYEKDGVKQTAVEIVADHVGVVARPQKKQESYRREDESGW